VPHTCEGSAVLVMHDGDQEAVMEAIESALPELTCHRVGGAIECAPVGASCGFDTPEQAQAHIEAVANAARAAAGASANATSYDCVCRTYC
jgi:hypothetical protein